MIATLRRAYQFPPATRRALVDGAIVQVAFAAALRLIPFRTVARASRRVHAVRRAASDFATLSRRLWAIEAAGRHLGGASTCLARALAAQWIAARHGVRLPVSIGVARGAGGSLDAHAWVAAHALVRVDADRIDRYRPLVTLEDAPDL